MVADPNQGRLVMSEEDNGVQPIQVIAIASGKGGVGENQYFGEPGPGLCHLR